MASSFWGTKNSDPERQSCRTVRNHLSLHSVHCALSSLRSVLRWCDGIARRGRKLKMWNQERTDRRTESCAAGRPDFTSLKMYSKLGHI